MTADWFTAHWHERCGSCNALIPDGAPVRRLRHGGLRCASCIKRLLGEDVPSHLASPPPATPASFSPFDDGGHE